MKRRGLIWKVLPPFLAIALVSLVAMAFFATHVVRTFHYARTRADLEAAVQIVLRHLQAREHVDEALAVETCRALADMKQYRFTILRANGNVLADTRADTEQMENHADRPEIRDALRSMGTGSSIRQSATVKEQLMYVAMAMVDGGHVLGVVRASRSMSDVDAVVQAMSRQIVSVGAVVAAIVVLLSIVVTRRISVPLDEIRRGAEQYAEGSLSHHLASSDVTEIDVLSNTLNRMAAQLNSRLRTITRERDEQSALLSCMLEAVVAVDMEKRLIKVNEAAIDLFRLDPRTCCGRAVVEMIRNADLLDIINRTLQGESMVEGDIELAESERWLQAHGTPLHDADGERIGALIVLNEMTRVRKLENMRRDFVANVSHELRTPVTSIKGFVETLLDGAAERPEDRDRFLSIILRQAGRLQSILDDLLILSRIEHDTEQQEVLFAPTGLKRLIENAVQNTHAAAEKARVTVAIECDDALKADVNLALLEQAVGNLLNNAITYSEPARLVVCRARLVSKEDVVIEVEDHGIGIARPHLDRIFERFYRVDKGRSRKSGGTGLGLAIVKRVALAHGGRVEAESSPGLGSTFRIYLPRHHAIKNG